MSVDKSKFMDMFRVETRERLEHINLGLLSLERNPKNKELLREVMRQAHSIKSSATMMGFNRIVEIAHKMEDGLDKALKGKLKLKKTHFDMFFKCLDSIELLIEDKVTWAEKGVKGPFVDKLCKEVQDTFDERQKKGDAEKKENKEAESGTEDDNTSARTPVAPFLTRESIRVDTDKLNKLVNLSGELVISKIQLNEITRSLLSRTEAQKNIPDNVSELADDLGKLNDHIGFLTDVMQEEVMKVRMVPVSNLFNTFPRTMRDLAHAKNKDIEFETNGGETQLDKAIVDRLKDALMHLLRNAVDHGIEKKGKIVLSAYREGSKVVIEVSDDGRGIDTQKVKEHAVKRKIVSENKVNDLAEEQVYQLLFTPGFTTKEEVSDISGRGVGLDVVRESIVDLKGMVEVFSSPGKGCSFIMRLPLTMAINKSLLVTAGTDIFAIPLETVVETIRITGSDIKTVENKEAVIIRGRILPLIRLENIFNLPQKGIFEKRFMPVVVVQSVEKRVAILVDTLIGRQDIISKSVGEPLTQIRNILGATILGNGRVILVLDIPSIINSAESVVIRPARPNVPKKAQRKRRKKTVLLAEDVLTTAMLEKNILESVGYSVVIARDGREALEKALQETFDIVITDVLMPRMDGFELVEALRSEKIYKDIPIIIVTTRENDEDKRRGLETGANAYILKKEFTSESLLNTLDRLLG